MIKNYDYYQEELDKVVPTENSVLSIKISRVEYDESNKVESTKWMHLSKDNIDTFINFLQELKNKIP